MKRERIFASLLPVVLVTVVLVGAWLWLGSYTRHGEQITVPELTGLSLRDAQQRVEGLGITVEVVDSVYNDDAPKATVTDQDPKAGRGVKPGRTVYLVMNARQPKMIDMPALVDLSKRQAMSVLEILGLRIGNIEYRPDPCTDCVVAQLYRGEPIAPDARIRRGEAITLVLGSGPDGVRVPVPDIVGLSWNESKAVLNMAGLNLGAVIGFAGCADNMHCDTALARVARQSPEAIITNTIGAGGSIDVWLTLEPLDNSDEP